jgi:hypothetical protein
VPDVRSTVSGYLRSSVKKGITVTCYRSLCFPEDISGYRRLGMHRDILLVQRDFSTPSRVGPAMVQPRTDRLHTDRTHRQDTASIRIILSCTAESSPGLYGKHTLHRQPTAPGQIPHLQGSCIVDRRGVQQGGESLASPLTIGSCTASCPSP